MKSSKASIRYARALFEIAKERGLVDRVEQDLESIGNMLGSSAEFRAYLLSPRIAQGEKKKAVAAMMSNADPLSIDFVQLLIDKRREDSLVEIAKMFLDLKRQAAGIVHARVETVTELDERLMGDLKAKLEEITGKHVELETELNEDLLGGMRIHLGSKLIDGSLKRRLDALREKLYAAHVD